MVSYIGKLLMFTAAPSANSDFPKNDYKGGLSDQLNPLPDQLASLSDQLEPLSDKLEPLSAQYKGLLEELPDNLTVQIKQTGPRLKNKDTLNDIICQICAVRAFSLKELSVLLRRKEKYLLEHFITPLREEGRLQYKFPDMPNHPGQAYKAG